MTPPTRSSRIPPKAALVAALIGLIMRVIVPFGFMLTPTPGHAGLMEITLCTQNGKVQAYLGDDGQIIHKSDLAQQGSDDDQSDGQSAHEVDCSCAASFAAGLPKLSSDQLVPKLAQQAAPAHLLADDLVPGRGLAAPPPPATAPPSLM